jgi:sensor histidine kinase regulating citrate/malate metabolism
MEKKSANGLCQAWGAVLNGENDMHLENETNKIIDAFPFCIILWQVKNDKIVCNHINKSAERLLKIKKENWIGRNIQDAYEPIKPNELQKLWDVVKTGNPWIQESYEYQGEKKFLIKFIAFKLKGDIIAVVTERKGQCKKTNRDGTQCVHNSSFGDYCMTHALVALKKS